MSVRHFLEWAILFIEVCVGIVGAVVISDMFGWLPTSVIVALCLITTYIFVRWSET